MKLKPISYVTVPILLQLTVTGQATKPVALFDNEVGNRYPIEAKYQSVGIQHKEKKAIHNTWQLNPKEYRLAIDRVSVFADKVLKLYPLGSSANLEPTSEVC